MEAVKNREEGSTAVNRFRVPCKIGVGISRVGDRGYQPVSVFYKSLFPAFLDHPPMIKLNLMHRRLGG